MGSKWCVKPPESWSSPQLRILFGWGKKGSGLTRLVRQVRFPSRIFLWKKKVLTPHKFYRSAINRGLRRLWTFSEKYYVTQRILFAGSNKKDSDASGIHKATKNTPAFGTRVPERTFCVLRFGRAKSFIVFFFNGWFKPHVFWLLPPISIHWWITNRSIHVFLTMSGDGRRKRKQFPLSEWGFNISLDSISHDITIVFPWLVVRYCIPLKTPHWSWFDWWFHVSSMFQACWA